MAPAKINSNIILHPSKSMTSSRWRTVMTSSCVFLSRWLALTIVVLVAFVHKWLHERRFQPAEKQRTDAPDSYSCSKKFDSDVSHRRVQYDDSVGNSSFFTFLLRQYSANQRRRWRRHKNKHHGERWHAEARPRCPWYHQD